jgi:hypothetical protein
MAIHQRPLMTTITAAVINFARISSQRKGLFPSGDEPPPPPRALYVLLQLAGNRRLSQFRRQPWDVAGHVDQRPVRGSHGKNPAPPLWYDLSARRHDIHLCRASNLGEIRAGVERPSTPLKVSGLTARLACEGRSPLFGGPIPSRQPAREGDWPRNGALANGSSKGLLAGCNQRMRTPKPQSGRASPPLQP